jgi:predicted ATPase
VNAYDAAMRLLERDAPLATLHALQRESLGGGRLVFVEGEAGVGKTSLVRAFRQSLPAGVRSTVGACDPLSTPRPFGPLLDIAADLGAALARAVDAGASRIDLLVASLRAALRPGSRRRFATRSWLALPGFRRRDAEPSRRPR